ncbi:MAG: DEAD/DEAH box helicase [Cyanobacteria bacterium SZAS LIN-3]|nr:DEAD/DEAH box helicase [Cyanobacteria bacterium SZAS LIN-3]
MDKLDRQLRLPFIDKTLDYDRVVAENSELRQEVARLKVQIEQLKGVSASAPDTVAESKASYSTPGNRPKTVTRAVDSRIVLFRSLFAGRDDVYAQRWEKADGTSNYSPAKHHDWDGHTKNERGKTVCAPACQLLPLTDRVIEEHLNGQRTIGIYPLLKDETCRFLAADFDESDWQMDVLAFLDTCDHLRVPAYLERSRSGNGAHVWIFFDRAVRASLARSLGSLLVSATKENRYQIAFKSYDRLFPNQDTMPKGGFGNLIALPLQLTSSKLGNAVFVDRNFQPFPDQWAFLSSIVRLTAIELETIVREASEREAIVTLPLSSDDEESDEPWKQKPSGKEQNQKFREPFPPSVSLVLGNMIYLPKAGFSSQSLNKIVSLAAFQNPEFYQKQATRQSTHDTPRVICCADDLTQHISLPRGCLAALRELLAHNNVSVNEIDERNVGSALDVKFIGTLRDDQDTAANAILSSEIGVLSASTAFGKTVVALYVIAERKVNTLILVHRSQLIEQWRERIGQFLNIPARSVGQLGDGKKKRTGQLDIATIQTLGRRGVVSDIVADYGQIIVDECHHLPAFTFEQIIKQSKAKFVLGLTATPVRKDGHHPIITMHCGPIIFKDSRRKHLLVSGVRHSVIPRPTTFNAPVPDSGINFSELYDELVADEQRNDLIFDDILKELDKGRSPLVLTERVSHLELFAERLAGFAKNVIVLKGGMSKKERSASLASLKLIPDDTERVVLSTGKYIGEGFDDPRLDTLFLLLPISFEGRVEQYAGRLHRQREGKTDVRIYDYVDVAHPVFRKMFERRRVKYKQLGYEIE